MNETEPLIDTSYNVSHLKLSAQVLFVLIQKLNKILGPFNLYSDKDMTYFMVTFKIYAVKGT